MKSYLKILIVAFLLSALFAIFSNSEGLFFLGNQSVLYIYQHFLPLLDLMQMIAYLINPVVIFVVFYFLGKRINLANELKTNILSLAIGSWIGYIIIHVPLTYFIDRVIGEIFGPTFLYYLPSTLFTGTLVVFSSVFFVALAALAIAFIRRPKPVIDSQPSESLTNNETKEGLQQKL